MAGEDIRERVDQADEVLHVAHLFEVEVMNISRRYALNGALLWNGRARP